MGSFDSDVNIQTLLAVFFLVFCLIVVVLGILLYRFQFLDGKSFSFSRPLGRLMIIVGAMLGLTAALTIVYLRFVF